jgi:hypothetical protein
MFSFGAKFCQKENLFFGLQVANLTKAVFGFFSHKNKGLDWFAKFTRLAPT